MMGKPKAPKAPDLVGLDAAQAARNKDAAYDVMGQNRYGQITPTGSNQWVTDPVTGKTNNVTTYSPEQQALYEKNNALAQAMSGGSGGALNQFMGQYWGGGGAAPSSSGSSGGFSYNGGGSAPAGNSPVGKGIQKDLDYSHLTAMPGSDPMVARQQAQDALYGRAAGYLDPQWQESQRSLETKLSNQGLVPGTAAYNRAMEVENAAKEKAYTGARQDAIAGGGAEQERQQALALALRNQGITEAGNLGAFHNAAQGQGANQWLTQHGQDTSANAQIQSAGIGAAAASQRAQMENELATRAQQFNELMGMGKFGQSGQMIPQFGISQGNLQPYGTGNAVGAASNDYQNQMAQYNARKNSGLGGMLPGIGSFVGNGLDSGWLSNLIGDAGPLLLAGG
jgi:hypothetical protein